LPGGAVGAAALLRLRHDRPQGLAKHPQQSCRVCVCVRVCVRVCLHVCVQACVVCACVYAYVCL
jgi:hypothetical protein